MLVYYYLKNFLLSIAFLHIYTFFSCLKIDIIII